MIPESVANFRKTYRQTCIPKYYSGIAHALFAGTVLISPIVYYASQLDQVSWKEFLAFPLMWLFGNWFEYIAHRYPLHHPYPGLKTTYQIHTREHHQYYTDKAISFETPQDFILVFFPWWSTILTVVLSSALAHWVIGPLISPNVGYIVALMAPAFFLQYELTHFFYHLSDDNFLTQIPILRSMRHHHRVHHNKRFMKTHNFNVTFPLCDWIYHTTLIQYTYPNLPNHSNLDTSLTPNHKPCVETESSSFS